MCGDYNLDHEKTDYKKEKIGSQLRDPFLLLFFAIDTCPFMEKEEITMRKLLRVLWLVFAFVAFLPLIALVEIYWLVICIKAAHIANEKAKEGLVLWYEYLKAGINMNKDFVINGL